MVVGMSSVPINTDRERMNFLLQRLESGTLDRDTARDELIPLLKAEMQRANKKGDFDREDDLQLLIDMLDSYIAGKIDLSTRPRVNVSLA
jgi:hypothetical protein